MNVIPLLFQSFEEVTVMFTYLIGFSESCAKMSAQQLVNSINSIFICFDCIVNEHEVLKVRVIHVLQCNILKVAHLSCT